MDSESSCSLHDRQISTQYFTDGKKEIDFILAFEKSEDESTKWIRVEFENYLCDEGLEIERDDKAESFDGKTYFVKIHAPWHVLAKHAELLNIKMPLKMFQLSPKVCSYISFHPRYTFSVRRQTVLLRIKQGGVRRSSFSYFASDKFCYNKDLIPDEPRYFCIPFRRPCEEHYVVQPEHEYFPRAQRSYIVWLILKGINSDSCSYSGGLPCEKGITCLLRKNVYTAAYPLHDGPVGCGKFRPGEEIYSDRRVLYSEWARFHCMLKILPLDKIRMYFGDRAGLFFAWMSLYTQMLVPLALIGLLVLCYGMASIQNTPASIEVCDTYSLGNYTMCPTCTRYCPYYKLVNLCSIIPIHYAFDNEIEILYSVVVMIWAFLVLKYWKRQEAKLIWTWDLGGHLEQDIEALKCKCKTRLNISRRMSHMMFLVLLLTDAVIAIITYQLVDYLAVLIIEEIFPLRIPAESSIVTSVISSILDVICIILLDKVYLMIAIWLTDFELWCTLHDFEKSLVKKAFMLQFVNTYASFMYIAFFKGNFTRFPGDTTLYFYLRENECQLHNCFAQVNIHFMAFIFIKYIFSMTLSWFFWNVRHKSYVSHKLSGIKSKEKLLFTSRWEEDYLLESRDYKVMLFDEYLNSVMQFGMITSFSVTFPPAPFFALVHNLIKLRIEALKCVAGYQRPVAFRVPNIGAWNFVLRFLMVFSVILNAFLVSFSSNVVPRQIFKFWYSCRRNLLGYHAFILSAFSVSDFPPGQAPIHPGIPNVTVCWHRGFIKVLGGITNPDLYTSEFLVILVARLAMVIIWQHVLFGIGALIFCCIPDAPHNIKKMKLQETTLDNEVVDKIMETICGWTMEYDLGDRLCGVPDELFSMMSDCPYSMLK